MLESVLSFSLRFKNNMKYQPVDFEKTIPMFFGPEQILIGIDKSEQQKLDRLQHEGNFSHVGEIETVIGRRLIKEANSNRYYFDLGQPQFFKIKDLEKGLLYKDRSIIIS
jgi:hypothetical protein